MAKSKTASKSKSPTKSSGKSPMKSGQKEASGKKSGGADERISTSAEQVTGRSQKSSGASESKDSRTVSLSDIQEYATQAAGTAKEKIKESVSSLRENAGGLTTERKIAYAAGAVGAIGLIALFASKSGRGLLKSAGTAALPLLVELGDAAKAKVFGDAANATDMSNTGV